MIGKRLSLVVLDYMSSKRTEDFLDAIAKKLDSIDAVSFVVVDNSVNQDNALVILNCLSECHQIELTHCKKTYRGRWKNTKIESVFCVCETNGGYASGNNLGMKVAYDVFKPEYAIVSNNDVICLDEKLDINLIDEIFKSQPHIGCLGPEIVGKRGEHQSPAKYINIEDRWIRMMLAYPFGRILGMTANDRIDNPTSGIVYRIMGSFMIFKTAAFVEVNGFDERTFLFAEESIIAEKLESAGYSTFYTDKIHMLHNHGETINKSYKEIARLRMKFESEMLYYRYYVKESSAKIFLAKILFPLFSIKFSIFNRLKRRES